VLHEVDGIAGSPVSVRAKRSVPLALALLLAALQASLLVSTARDKSDTVDEDIYLPAAAILWARHDFSVNPESPVLPKWAFAAAMRTVEPRLDETPAELERAGNYVLWYGTRARIERLLLAARLTTIAATTLAGLLLWSVARRFGPAAALVTHALWCFSPAVLAAGALATLDAWVTAFVIALVWATARAVEKGTASSVVIAGVIGGLALACKITALGAVAAALAACAIAAWRGARASGRAAFPAAARTAFLFFGAGAIALWAVYGFTFGRVATAALDGIPAAIGSALPAVPFPAWVEGVLSQLSHAARGHRGYLFGETSLTGWRSFYLVALALKTTIGAQVLAMLLVATWIWRRPRGRDLWWDAALLGYPVLLVAVMSAGRTQLGLRYILPAYPGAMLWAGRTFPLLAAVAPPWSRIAGIAALCLGIAGSLRVHPHHLMFFNDWIGGPENGPQYIVTGDCIGQDQRRLADWQKAEGLPSIYYTWYSGRPEYWGIAYSAPPCEPHAGVYALEAIEVHRPRRIEAGCLDWLTVDPPDERIGYDIYVYRVPRERVLRLRQTTTRVPFWKSAAPPAR
jgi:dolichyl-phosphate-mannose-protein mannosyltransferase